jgi:hypothetical protein
MRVEDVLAWIREHPKLRADDTFELLNTRRLHRTGAKLHRYRRHHRGVWVMGDVVLLEELGGEVVRVSARLTAPVELSVTPRLSLHDLRSLAESAVEKDQPHENGWRLQAESGCALALDETAVTDELSLVHHCRVVALRPVTAQDVTIVDSTGQVAAVTPTLQY